MRQNDPESSRDQREQKRLNRLRQQLLKIIDEEARRCLRKGTTTLEIVDASVAARTKVLMRQLGPVLAIAERRALVRRRLKRTVVPMAHIERATHQMEFADMEEFRGIPPTVTFQPEHGPVDYISYLDTTEFERAAALQLLARSIAADQQTYLALKAGNEFAARLVKKYGDLPLWDLYSRYREDRATGTK